MRKYSELSKGAKRNDLQSFLWVFFYIPLIWILAIHLGTRFMWFLGI